MMNFLASGDNCCMFGEPQDIRPKDPAICDLICTNSYYPVLWQKAYGIKEACISRIPGVDVLVVVELVIRILVAERTFPTES